MVSAVPLVHLRHVCIGTSAALTVTCGLTKSPILFTAGIRFASMYTHVVHASAFCSCARCFAESAALKAWTATTAALCVRRRPGGRMLVCRNPWQMLWGVSAKSCPCYVQCMMRWRQARRRSLRLQWLSVLSRHVTRLPPLRAQQQRPKAPHHEPHQRLLCVSQTRLQA